MDMAKKWARYAIGAVASISAACGLAYWRIQVEIIDDLDAAAAENDKAFAFARQQGVPLSIDELRDHLKAPSDGKPYLGLKPDEVSQLGKFSVDLTAALDVSLAKADELLSENKATVMLAEAFAREASLAVKRDFDVPPSIDQRESSRTRTIARLLCARMESRWARGDDYGAIEDLKLVRRIARDLNPEPLYFDVSTQLAIEGLLFRSIERAVARRHVSDGEIADLQAAFRATAFELPIADVFRNESYYGLALMRNAEVFGTLPLFTDDEVGPLERRWRDWWGLNVNEADTFGLIDHSFSKDPSHWTSPETMASVVRKGAAKSRDARAFQTRLLQFWGEVYRMHREENYTMSDAIQYMIQKFKAEQGKSYRGVVKGLVTTDLEVLAERLDAQRVVVDSMLSIARYRARTNRMPKSLSEAGAILKDPRSNERVALVFESGVARVVGRGYDNQVDLGAPASQLRNRDVVSIFPRSIRSGSEASNDISEPTSRPMGSSPR